jgi:hypothetical protein
VRVQFVPIVAAMAMASGSRSTSRSSSTSSSGGVRTAYRDVLHRIVLPDTGEEEWEDEDCDSDKSDDNETTTSSTTNKIVPFMIAPLVVFSTDCRHLTPQHLYCKTSDKNKPQATSVVRFNCEQQPRPLPN